MPVRLKKLILALFLLTYILLIFALFELPYVNKTGFISPLPQEAGIIIRNDRWGKGYYGARRNNGRIHQAVDLQTEVLTAVLAPLSGKVIKVGKNPKAGNYLKLYHPPNLTTYYCHLNSVTVKKGQRVKQKEPIAATGKTGNAKLSAIKPHLHFEVCLNGIPQNPLNFVTPAEE